MKVYALALATFTVGLVELMIGGVLPKIATELRISISAAGQLITVFALVYAVAGPTLLALTAKLERKRLYLVSMLVFAFGCLIAFLGPNFTMLLLSRIITAISGALVTVLSLTIAVSTVSAAYRARVVGIILMGVSSAIVLGVPLGVLISDYIGWRFLFLLIALLSLLVFVVMSFTLERIQPEQVVSLRTQLTSLKNIKIMSAHFVTCLVLAGHYTLYAYFTPFLETMMNIGGTSISTAYFIFGVAAVSGGMVGGFLSDRIGTTKSILLVVSLFAFVMFILPFATFNLYVFTFVLIFWGVLSWGISPPQQSYLIQSAPETANIQQSVNLTFLQLGIAAGSAFGGIVFERTGSFYLTSLFGGGLIVVAFFVALFSITRPLKQGTRIQEARAE